MPHNVFQKVNNEIFILNVPLECFFAAIDFVCNTLSYYQLMYHYSYQFRNGINYFSFSQIDSFG